MRNVWNGGTGIVSGMKRTYILIPALPLVSCVQLGNMQISLNLSIFINSPENKTVAPTAFM